MILSRSTIPALDGLRGIAILLVAISHWGFGNLVPGGFGVTLFFFLSGFLISRQLMTELSEKGHIEFGNFYMRRFLRLAPPFFAAIIITGFFYSLIGGELRRWDTLSAVFYGANFYDLYRGYLTSIPGIRHPFNELWSLAVEEHFYIFFPALLATFYARGKCYIHVLIVFILASLIWRLTLWNACELYPNFCGIRGIAERLYMGTDTRFDSLLYGALLSAILYGPYFPKLEAFLRREYAFFIGIVVLLISFMVRNEYIRDVWRYSIDGLALMPIFACVLSNDLLATILSNTALRKIGHWSYSIYLYHWIGLMAADYAHRIGFAHEAAVGITVTVILALSSYYGLEHPIMRWRRKLSSQH
jgi:peptidoglycan/LPS O-acetylase OafA/YrhL